MGVEMLHANHAIQQQYLAGLIPHPVYLKGQLLKA